MKDSDLLCLGQVLGLSPDELVFLLDIDAGSQPHRLIVLGDTKKEIRREYNRKYYAKVKARVKAIEKKTIITPAAEPKLDPWDAMVYVPIKKARVVEKVPAQVISKETAYSRRIRSRQF